MVDLRSLVADTRPLQEPHFRRLWLANIITVVGAQLTVVAVPAQIYADTGSSAYVGLTGVFGLVPLVVFGLYGGALADVFDRRTILVITTVGLIVTSGLFWLQAFVGGTNVWLLLSLFSVQQAFFAVNQPTRSAVLPKILPAELLPAANSLNMTVFQAGAIGGPLIAGVLIPVVGLQWLYLVDTVTLFATLAAVVRLPSLAVVGAAAAAPGIRAVVEGFAYLRHQPVLLMSFVVDLIAMVFGMPRALFPEIAHLDFGGPEAGGLAFALLFAAIPAGAVLGGVFSGWVSRVEAQGRAVIVCILVWGAGDGRLRPRGRVRRPGPHADAGARAGDAGRRRRGRHGLRGVPHEHAPERGGRRRARPAPGRVHRRGRGRAADRRRPARRERRHGRYGGRRGRRRRARGDRHGRRRAARAGVRALPAHPTRAAG